MTHFIASVPFRLFALILLITSLAACSKSVRWTEEVELGDGQKLVIERETKQRPGGAELAIGSGWRPERYIIRFRYPPNSDRMIEWNSSKMDLERGTEPEFPLLLDVELARGLPYVVTMRWLRGACYEYVRYVLHDGAWSEVPLPAEFEPRDANLYLPAAALDIPKHVSLTLKLKENADIRYSVRLKKIGPKQTDCRA